MTIRILVSILWPALMWLHAAGNLMDRSTHSSFVVAASALLLVLLPLWSAIAINYARFRRDHDGETVAPDSVLDRRIA